MDIPGATNTSRAVSGGTSEGMVSASWGKGCKAVEGTGFGDVAA